MCTAHIHICASRSHLASELSSYIFFWHCILSRLLQWGYLHCLLKNYIKEISGRACCSPCNKYATMKKGMRGLRSWRGELWRSQTELLLKRGWLNFNLLQDLWIVILFFFDFSMCPPSALSMCPKELSFLLAPFVHISEILCLFSWPWPSWLFCLSCTHLLLFWGFKETEIIIFKKNSHLCHLATQVMRQSLRI